MKAEIYWLKESESTNTEAWDRILNSSEGSANLSVIAAERQTSGRGQGDHVWHSEPGKNLTFTIILRYGNEKGMFLPFPAIDQKAISDMTAQAVVDYLATKGLKAWIKQPNDIYIEARKICGLLIKHSLRKDCLQHTIVGIGLNINECNFPEHLPNPTSLMLELRRLGQNPEDFDVKKELQDFLEIYEKACSQLFTLV